jgi:hypothetical protein
MGLIAAIARWRDRYVLGGGQGGMTAEEMVAVLRGSLPLVELPDHRGKRVSLWVIDDGDAEEVSLAVRRDGRLMPCDSAKAPGWAEARIGDWCTALLEGFFEGFKGEDERLVDDCVQALYRALWEPAAF